MARRIEGSKGRRGVLAREEKRSGILVVVVLKTVEVHGVKEFVKGEALQGVLEDSGGSFCEGSTAGRSEFNEKGEDRVLGRSGRGKKGSLKILE